MNRPGVSIGWWNTAQHQWIHLCRSMGSLSKGGRRSTAGHLSCPSGRECYKIHAISDQTKRPDPLDCSLIALMPFELSLWGRISRVALVPGRAGPIDPRESVPRRVGPAGPSRQTGRPASRPHPHHPPSHTAKEENPQAQTKSGGPGTSDRNGAWPEGRAAVQRIEHETSDLRRLDFTLEPALIVFVGDFLLVVQ